ncbi:MAG: VCBS repeat-containing protein [Bacteroidota bacterium]
MKKHLLLFLTALSALIYLGCNSTSTTTAPTQFVKKSSAETGIDFINEVTDQENFNVLTYRNYYNGGGVAIGDINGDGLSDLFFTANMGPNRLFLNQGGLVFEDITDQAGVSGSMKWSTGVTFADVNADGLQDIYVCNSGDVSGQEKVNELYINNGDLTFTESAAKYGLADQGYSTHASFFDYDGDGDLDVYLLNNSFKDPSRIDFKNVRNERDSEGGDKLYRNDDRRFTDVSTQAGIYGSKIGFGLGVSVSDINGDHRPDIYISNDFWERDYLYINEGDGTFSEELTSRITQTSTASMGADIADMDNNGTYEIFSTDMLPATTERLRKTTIFNDYKLEDLKYRSDYHYQYTQNCFQLNDGTGQFQEIANQLGVAATDWSWAALLFDFDNDGHKDIFVSNGVYHDITDMDFSDFIDDRAEVRDVVAEKGRFDFRDFLELLPQTPLSNYAYLNSGRLSFSDETDALGLGGASYSNGSAYADLDNDGDLDLIVNNVNMPAAVYENQGSSNSFLKFAFEGSLLNPHGIGTEVRITTNSDIIAAQNYQARGFQSSTEPKLTIGLGDAKQVSRIEVFWPTGEYQLLENISANQSITLRISDSSESWPNSSTDIQTQPLLAEITLSSPIIHEENLLNDFDNDPLMLHMLSAEGPRLIHGDINGDSREDLIVLGAEGQSTQTFLAATEGYRSLTQESFQDDASYEMTTGLLLDLDRDGDLDLICGIGGNDPSKDISYYKVRSYLNDGAGIFEKNTSIILPIAGNLSEIVALQIGGQRAIYAAASCVPGNYGLIPRNFLITEGPNGQWSDITTRETGQVGMVSSMSVADVDQDGDNDLVLAGEWMNITVLENTGTSLEPKVIPNSSGLWQHIQASDIDQDGDQDLIVGNWGSNSKLTTNEELPLTLLVGDADQNGKSECLLLWAAPEDEELHLFAAKRNLTSQLPSLKKRILKNHDYAEYSYQELLRGETKTRFRTYEVDLLTSGVYYNQGSGRFTYVEFDKAAQRSSVHTSEVVDIDKDGRLDIIIGGNTYGLKPEIGRMSSQTATVLRQAKDGDFEVIPRQLTGLNLTGELRDIARIRQTDREVLLFGLNNEELVAYEVQ